MLLVYDVGLRESFEALDSWLGEMKQEMGSQANMESIVFIVCANKVREHEEMSLKTFENKKTEPTRSEQKECNKQQQNVNSDEQKKPENGGKIPQNPVLS